MSLVEVLLILLVVAAASAALHAYLSETKKSLDTLSARRPLGHARLAGDLATLAAIRSQLDVYHATHGQWPPSRDAVAAVLRPAPRFQCAGNDYTYDPVSGQVGLVIADPGRC